jgi:putative membrane protein
MVKDSLTTLVSFAAHFGTGLGLLVIGIFIFALSTRHDEYKLVSSGNVSAGILIAGNILGLLFTLGGAASNSVDYIDFLVWGVVGIVSQVIAYHLFDLLVYKINFSDEIEKNNIGVAAVVAAVLMGVGYFIAKCMTY